MSLSSFRGKFLLLDFWARWCGPCVASIPELKALRDSLSTREDFALLSVSLDTRKEEAIEMIQKKRMDWPQAVLTNAAQRQTPARYGVVGIPALFLISPDGKIVGQTESFAEMRAIIVKVLEKASNQK
jgi:thiol-disulfide isomerase/thioredoxin